MVPKLNTIEVGVENMTYREAYKITKDRRKWLWKSKKLFCKYGKLDYFDYNITFDDGFNVICDDYITVGNDDKKVYYVVDNKEAYKRLKDLLDLEIQIRYKNDTH